MKARFGILLTMLVAYVSTATAGGQHELPPITVVGRPAHVPAANPLPPRPESHAWGWSNAVGRHLGFDPQVAEATLRQNDDCGGNPVERFSGNKIEPELDFASSGGLSLQRTYSHAATPLQHPRHETVTSLFGPHWRSSFDYSLEFMNLYTEVWAWRPDGRRIQFVLSQDGSGRWEEWLGNGRRNPKSYICCLQDNAAGVFTLHDETNGVETYRQYGITGEDLSYFRAYIVERRNEQGETWTFTGMPRLQNVQHSSGRSVHFGWTGGVVTSVIDPAGQVVRYGYDGIGLTTATLPGDPATTIRYHYENGQHPGALTGKSFNDVRYSTFAYDGNGRAISTEHAGGVERTTFGYAGSASARQVTETNPLGRTTVHAYEHGKKVAISGQQSPNCPAASQAITYDANGWKDTTTDFAGHKTDHDHDVHGHLLAKVEGAGTPKARTTRYVWDEARNRIVEATVEGISKTHYAYTAHGRPERIDEQDLQTGRVRSTTYSYTFHGNGLPATVVVDGPSPGEDIVETWSATGDLLEVRNAAGQVTAWSSHNGRGQPGRIVSPAGDVTELEYDARGRIAVERRFPNGQPVETVYVYGASGLLSARQSGNGNTRVSHYDAAQRLIQEDLTAPDGSVDVRRITYNALSQPSRVEIGRGTPFDASQVTQYEYDELGRLIAERSGNAGNLVARYAYDANGRVTETANALGETTRLTYDALGRVATSTDAKGGVTRFDYDAADRLGRVTGITSTKGGKTQTVLDRVRYRPFGGPESWTYGNGLERRYNIDDQGRLFGVSAVDAANGKVAQSLTYGFEGADRVNAITNATGQPARQDFGYDQVGRLAWDNISGQSGHDLIDAYDANGNRTRHGWDGEVEQHAIDPHSNRVLDAHSNTNSRRRHADGPRCPSPP